jgi:hypothetical protein
MDTMIRVKGTKAKGATSTRTSDAKRRVTREKKTLQTHFAEHNPDLPVLIGIAPASLMLMQIKSS